MDNNCKSIIEKRKSVRNFTKKEVSNSDIYDILDCARLAPSSKNRQPWRFKILSAEEKERVVQIFYDRLCEENTEETGFATIKIMRQASKVVLAFMKHREIEAKGLRLEPYILSMGASIENALLRATELGIGSLWVYDIVAIEKELVNTFSDGDMFISALCFGYEDGDYPRAKKKTLDEILID